MLTRAHAIAVYKDGQIVPDRLTRPRHAAYLAHADRLLDIYRQGVGRTRRELYRAVQAVFAREADCPLRRIAAFAKLLDDRSTYSHDRPGEAAALRRQVFRLAAPLHPLVGAADRQFEHAEMQAKTHIAARLGRSWDEIDQALFADVPELHRLTTFDGYPDGPALLSRYNVAQVQVALFDAVSLTVRATEDFKVILRYAKLAGLMHAIRSLGERGYEFRFDGPASALRQTRRYGVAMACFLPALLACSGWRLHAVLRTRRGWQVSLDLSPADRLTSHLPPPEEFDSHVEEDFARAWGPSARGGWRLVREGVVLHQGQHVFVPDFVFCHDDGRVVVMEIIGFWTPEYLAAKSRTLRTFADHPFLLAVAEGLAQQLDTVPARAIRFKSRLTVKAVLERLQAPAASPPHPPA
jgi:predicted nuclease of restriction endonuclease-like RecB superfamily